MAANYRTSKYRTTSLSERDKSGFYVYGNTVRQAETLTEKNEESVFAAEGADETDKQPGC